MQPFTREARYMNYLDHDDASHAAPAYGINYARLQQVKAQYDPDNMFRQNLNIRPAPATPAAASSQPPGAGVDAHAAGPS